MKVMVVDTRVPDCSVSHFANEVLKTIQLLTGEVMTDSRLTAHGLVRVDTRDLLVTVGLDTIAGTAMNETIVTKAEAELIKERLSICGGS